LENEAMPQLLSKVTLPASFSMYIGVSGSDHALTNHNPKACLLALEVITTWSHFESFMLGTYVKIMGGKHEDAAHAYLAVEIQSAKIAMINAVARRKLDPRYCELLSDIISVAKSSQKTRDKLAHWIWGFSPELPNAFLLVNPKDWETRKGIRLENGRVVGRHDGIYVFTEDDFLKALAVNNRLCDFGIRFHMMLAVHVSEQDSIFHTLCAEPEIQEKIVARRASQTRSRQ
jgi:hypothetical protein